ncbi:hypothetical protein AN958_12636 [Leucoagaricus sp. SymC.cos]|nr:hypothetical protein AN958_12636 [Leucoagaricus sp. SymC.cos]
MVTPLVQDYRHNSPNISRALNLCQFLEKSIMDNISSLGTQENNQEVLRKLEEDLMFCKVVGFLIIFAPREEARNSVALSVDRCASEEELLELGRFYERYFLRRFRRIPRSDHREIAYELIEKAKPFSTMEELRGSLVFRSPRNIFESQKSALVRDNFKCILSGIVAAQIWRKYADLFERVEPQYLNFTACCPIMTNNARNWAETKVNATRFPILQQAHVAQFATNAQSIFTSFGYPDLAHNLDGNNIHSLCNVLTLRTSLQAHFNELNLWFEPTGIPGHYRVFTPQNEPTITDFVFRIALAQPAVQLTTPDPVILELPSPDLLELHAACCKVANASGLHDFYQAMDPEYGECHCGDPDGECTCFQEWKEAKKEAQEYEE